VSLSGANPENDGDGSSPGDSVRVHVRSGENTLIYNKDVRGRGAARATVAAPGVPAAAGHAPAAASSGDASTAALLAALSNPAIAAQLQAAMAAAASGAAGAGGGVPVSPPSAAGSRRNSADRGAGFAPPGAAGNGMITAMLANAIMANGGTAPRAAAQ
jgi:hypothetical protein